MLIRAGSYACIRLRLVFRLACIAGGLMRRIICPVWREWHRRKRHIHILFRDRYSCFISLLVLLLLVSSWCVVLSQSWHHWQEMRALQRKANLITLLKALPEQHWQDLRALQRNANLITLLKAFPKQYGTNITEYQLNVHLSNMIPLDRSIPDTRPKDCLSKYYDLYNLPTVSIIIPFYNEAWSMLLRCLHSIIDKTPKELIYEVILVDDFSDYHYLKKPLQDYVSELSDKIYILRTGTREGLIRARSLAARQAEGDVLVFLDAHVECNENWLPPLLEVVQQNSSTMAIPHIDNITPNTLEYKKWSGTTYGSFQWNMDYVWKLVPNDTIKSRGEAENYFTATTIGCAMAIDRIYFWKLGGFDDDMYIWGGENLELSFRTWMCGGSMKIVPCSRIGHLFRKWLPYSFPSKYGGGYIKYKNYQRAADAWMDDYRMYYYASVRGEVFYSKKDISSLKKRKQLREQLKCKSFKWYLDHVTPDVIIPSVHANFYGQLKNLASNACSSGNMIGDQDEIPISYCGNQSPDQTFMHMQDGTIRQGDKCMTAVSTATVSLRACLDSSPRQLWLRQGKIREPLLLALYPEAGDEFTKLSVDINGDILCLTYVNIDNMHILSLVTCSDAVGLTEYQYWSFTLEMDYMFAKQVLDRRTEGV